MHSCVASIRRCVRRSRWIRLSGVIGLALGWLVAWPAAAELRVAIAWDDDAAGTSWLGVVDADAPDSFVDVPLELPGDGVVHFADGTLYHVSRTAGALTRIEVGGGGWMSVATTTVGAAFELRDVAVVDANTAWLAARANTTLLRFDLATATVSAGVDLAPLGVAPGVLMPERMLVHEGRVYLQLRRPLGSPLPSYVAVIEMASETIVDADPGVAGVQAVELEGTEPRWKMQIIPGTNRLMLSATGALLDFGGIEIIDLDTLESEGVVFGDMDGYPTNDFGPFLMLDDDRGWFSGATSIVESSHLFELSLSNPQPSMPVGNEIFFTSPNLVHDPATNRLFWPIPDGIRFYDATTGVEDPASPALLFSGTTTDIEPVLLPDAVPGPGPRLAFVLAAIVVSAALSGRLKSLAQRD